MRKLLLSLIAIALTFNIMAQNVWDGTTSPWTNGSGTENDPYLIETAANLAYVAEKVNEGYQASGQRVFDGVYFLQTTDFDLNNINWTPIGNVDSNSNGYYFAGIYDGDYHEISRMSITSSLDVVGLFGAAGGNSVVKHVFVNQGNIVSSGTGAAGIIGGLAGDAIIDQCAFEGTISITYSGTYCGAAGVVGVAGNDTKISQCSFDGTINASNSGITSVAVVGGICAFAQDNVEMSGCYSTGDITSSTMALSAAGGILGATLNEASIKMNSCYNVGTVNANISFPMGLSYAGGVFGLETPEIPSTSKATNTINVTNCFYLNTVASPNDYGTPKTSDEMKTEAFKNDLNQSTHTFVMDDGTNNGYPILSLYDVTIYEASEITNTSALLSAKIHKGNASLSRACFIYSKDTNMTEVDVATDGYVEAALENLEANTQYMFGVRLYFADGTSEDYYPHYFTTDYDAIEEISSNEIMIYPNPATDFIYVNNDKPVDIQVFTLDGKLISSEKEVTVIDVRDLESGAYLININGEATRFIKR